MYIYDSFSVRHAQKDVAEGGWGRERKEKKEKKLTIYLVSKAGTAVVAAFETSPFLHSTHQ